MVTLKIESKRKMTQNKSKIKVGIVGGTGYTGVELLRILSQHPAVELAVITSRGEAGQAVSAMFPSLRGYVDLVFSDPTTVDLSICDVVFFATPHGVAMQQAEQLVAKGTKVIDLAADFRMQNLAKFEQWYEQTHACPELLKQSVYGIPEINHKHIAQADVIGNPGCYPTTIILGLAPLLKAKCLDLSIPIIADAKSGVSGAGRKASVGTLFSEASDNMKPYGVAGHRHHPEIVEQLQKLAGKELSLIFTPHLTPMIRGMLSTIYVKLSNTLQKDMVYSLYNDFYASSPFVDCLPLGMMPETRTVRASNHLRIGMQLHENDYLTILVVQDNLVKGAAGQAVQNMNLMFNLNESTGLSVVPVLP